MSSVRSRLRARWPHVVRRKQIERRVRVGRIGGEDGDALERSSGVVAGLLDELPARAGGRVFAGIDRAGRQFQDAARDAVLVLAHEHDAALGRECEDHAEAARLANVVVFDAASVGQDDGVAAQAQMRRVDHEL